MDARIAAERSGTRHARWLGAVPFVTSASREGSIAAGQKRQRRRALWD